MTTTLELPDDDVVYIAEQLLGEMIEADYLERPQRFVISEDTVLDTSTGLTWQRWVSERKFTWAAAQDYAATLTLDGGGWRVPDVKELETLVDQTRINPCVDTAAFPDAPRDCLWSASPYEYHSRGAWYVNVGGGYTSFSYVYLTYRVRCVR